MLEAFRRLLGEEKDPSAVRVLVLCGARHARRRPAAAGEAVLARLLETEIEGLAGKTRSILLQPLRAPTTEADPPLAALAGAVGEGEALFLPLRDSAFPPLREPGAYPLLLGSRGPAPISDFYDGVVLFREGTPVAERKPRERE
jgi:hypothetical protein